MNPTQNPEYTSLGAMIMNDEARAIGLSILSTECFQDKKLAKVFEAIESVDQAGDPVDFTTLSQAMGIENLGNALYLATITRSTATSANIEAHCKIILERYNMKKLRGAIVDAGRTSTTAEELLGSIRDAEKDILKQGVDDVSPISELLSPAIDKIEKKQGIDAIKTGYYDIDKMMIGLAADSLNILAARPSVGKTSLGLGIAMNAAREGNRCLFISIEMASADLMQRLLSSDSEVSLQKVRQGFIQKEELTRIVSTANDFYNKPLIIADKPGASLKDIEETVAREAYRSESNPLKLVVVDYIQLVNAPNKAGIREQEVSLVSRSLKMIARKYKVAVLALSQLSRASEKREDNKPRLSDLRDSGAIEQDADTVIFLHQDRAAQMDNEYKKIQVILAKNRNGPTTRIEMDFKPEYTKFVERIGL